MKITTQYILALLIFFQTGWVLADEIYKSVDEAGKVTYSSEPPEDSVKIDKVEVAPGPSKQSVEQAQQTHKKTQQTANTIDKENKKIEADRAAQQKSRDAEASAKQKNAEAEVYRDQQIIRDNRPVAIIPPRPVRPAVPPPHGQPGHPPANHPRPVQLPN